MEAIIVYFSKSGNTRGVADAMAQELDAPSHSVNLMEKKGRGTKEDRDREKELFNEALEASRGADLALIGTPTSFKQAKSQILSFTSTWSYDKTGNRLAQTKGSVTTSYVYDANDRLQQETTRYLGSE